MLVDGKRVAGMINDAAELRVVKLKGTAADPVQPFARNSEGADRVENPQKADPNIGVAHLAQLGMIGGETLLGPRTVVAPGKLEVRLVTQFRAQETAGGDK